MELTNRDVAAIAALAVTVLLLTAPTSHASEGAPPKAQDRVSEERLAAPTIAADAAREQFAIRAARSRRQDRIAVAGECWTAATWSEILRCVFVTDGQDRRRRNQRTITVETRVGENTSVLTRVPADIAAR